MLTRTKTRIIFGSALLLFCLSAAAAVIAITRLRDAERWVTHTHDVQTALAHLTSLVARAGRSRTAYVDSGNPDSLHENQATLAEIPQALSELRSLTADNPRQQQSCDHVADLARQRAELMAQSIALKLEGKSTLEAQAHITQATVSLAGQIDDLLQEMANHEQQLLSDRVARRRRREYFAAAFLALTFAIAGLLFIIDFRLLTNELEAREAAQRSLQKLSARVLTIRDEERRRFSRELHDSMGQHLASAKMHLDILSQSMPENAAIREGSELLDQALSETRTLSYLLHPPLLDEAGFESAAREYVDGFSKRSGIPAALRMPESIERFGSDVELALFRVLQEALTNLHRHSGCSQATVTVAISPRQVALSVRDNGHGVAPGILEGFRNDGAHLGVGLAGMRERVRELGGHLDLHSDVNGTLLTAVLPRTKKQASQQQSSTSGPA